MTNNSNQPELPDYYRLEHNHAVGMFHFASINVPPPHNQQWRVLMKSISCNNAMEFTQYADDHILDKDPHCDFATMLNHFHEWLAESD
jgi:hypothetical protein